MSKKLKCVAHKKHDRFSGPLNLTSEGGCNISDGIIEIAKEKCVEQ